MKWVSIQLKIVSVIVGILVVTLLAVLVFSVSSARRNLLLAADKTLAANTRMLAQALQTIMLIGEAPIAVRTLENLQLIEELEKIDIYRANGERAFHDYATLETVNRIRKKKFLLAPNVCPIKNWTTSISSKFCRAEPLSRWKTPTRPASNTTFRCSTLRIAANATATTTLYEGYCISISPSRGFTGRYNSPAQYWQQSSCWPAR